MGMVYIRGKTWWVQFRENGKTIRESSESKSKTVAKTLLKLREGNIVNRKASGYQFDKVRFDDLSDLVIRDYELNKRKSIKRAERSVYLLREFFDNCYVKQITSNEITKYTLHRLKQGASNATVNRELSALRRMFSLGAEQTPTLVDIYASPKIEKLEEDNVRAGFFEHDEYLALMVELPDHLKPVVAFGYRSGWRLDEITTLTWSQVDRKNGIVRLEAGTTKNKDARTLYFDDDLKEVIEDQWKKRKSLLPWVFLNRKGTDHVKRFDKAFKSACKRAKIEIKLFHDLRRTAVRNMVRSGIPEKVAMTISGHKTRSVFDRYNIVSDQDLKLAAQKQANYLKSQIDTSFDTIGKITKIKNAINS